MKKSLILLLLVLIFLTSLVNAKIDISEPEEVYNLGDKLYITVITTPKSIYGNFEINLVCKDSSLNIYKVPAEPSFSLGEEQTISTYIALTSETIGNLTGECNLVALIGDEQISTKDFLITDQILVSAGFDKANYDPLESIILDVEAIKLNDHPLNGFLDVSGAAEFSKAIENGFMTETFVMPETTEAGEYTLKLFIYDKTANNEILNKANTSISFSINQIPSFIQTSLSELEIKPGTSLTISTDIFDQSGKQMPGTVSVLVLSPKQEEIQRTIKSEEFDSIDFPANATPGIWKIFSFFENVADEKEFQVQAFQKVDFEFLGQILIIRNTGNCVYNKTIEITIKDEIQKLENLNIQVAEERRFRLRNEKGEGEVVVSDGESSITKTILFTGGYGITGFAVYELTGLGIFSEYPIIWIFIIVILALIAILVFLKFRKRSVKLSDKMQVPAMSKTMSEEGEQKKEGMIDISKPKISEGESTLVLKGEKNKAAVVSLKIKNYPELKENERQELIKVLSIAKEKKGMIEFKDSHIIIVFSPLMTKTFDNEILAAKVGFDILKELVEYNKKFTNKIKFNIGINSGDLINSLQNQKLKYTSIGNTILIAKKLSDLGESKLLVSEQVRNKLMRDLKVEKAGTIGKTNIYSVTRITDREANKAKLQDLLKRMGKD